MTQIAPDTPDSEMHLGEAPHPSHRRVGTRRILGRCLLATCAISIGVILASDPKVTKVFTGTQPEATKSETPQTDDDSAGLSLPTGIFSTVSALSNSARSVFGTTAEPDDMAQTGADPEATAAEPSTTGGGFFSFGSNDDSIKPVVSAMPQNRIPVRRAGLNSN